MRLLDPSCNKLLSRFHQIKFRSLLLDHRHLTGVPEPSQFSYATEGLPEESAGGGAPVKLAFSLRE
jgi:hypothetical protein